MARPTRYRRILSALGLLALHVGSYGLREARADEEPTTTSSRTTETAGATDAPPP